MHPDLALKVNPSGLFFAQFSGPKSGAIATEMERDRQYGIFDQHSAELSGRDR